MYFGKVDNIASSEERGKPLRLRWSVIACMGNGRGDEGTLMLLDASIARNGALFDADVPLKISVVFDKGKSLRELLDHGFKIGEAEGRGIELRGHDVLVELVKGGAISIGHTIILRSRNTVLQLSKK